MNEQRTVKLIDGRQLGFAEYGDPNGIPIFYFHGTPGSRLEAGPFQELAVANRCRLIGIDRPGLGLSSLDKKRSILSWATDVTHFADCLKIEKFSIIGHSGGAPFVAACAYAIPDRLKSAVIVSGMAPLNDPESQIEMARGQRVANKLIRAMPWLTHVMMKLTLVMLKKPNMMDKMIKQLPEVDQALFYNPESRKALINSTLEAFRNGIAGPAYEMKLLANPWGFDLKTIKYPMTIWQGTLDRQAPMSHAKIYANLVAGAQLKIIENEGHLSLLKNHMEEILRDILIN